MHIYTEKWYVGRRIDAFVAWSFDMRLWGLGISLSCTVSSVDFDLRIGPFGFNCGVSKHYEYEQVDS